MTAINGHMKTLNSNKKIAIKADSCDANLYKTLFGKDKALKILLVEPGLSAYLLSDGTTIEIYGAGSALPDYLFANSNVVISYQVENLEDMVEALSHQGGSLLGAIETVCSTYKYCHILSKDRMVIGLYEQR